MESRFVIGTSNAAEFFITTIISLTFLGTIGLELWPMITGLIIGGVVAAPFGAATVIIATPCIGRPQPRSNSAVAALTRAA